MSGTSSRRETLPVFPLTGTLLLPGTYLPLNVFEPRYLAMVRDALDGGRAIGMIQPEVPGLDNWGVRPVEEGEPLLYPVGCKGRIARHEPQDDGRCHIVLEGVSRFRVVRELEPVHGYRRVEADLAGFEIDRAAVPRDLETTGLQVVLAAYARRKGLEIDADLAASLPGERLVNVLSTALPFSPAEKQALLEAPSPADRKGLLISLMEIELETPVGPISPQVVN